nr:hypothetical protein CFP56_43469 [Quercus suber]
MVEAIGAVDIVAAENSGGNAQISIPNKITRKKERRTNVAFGADSEDSSEELGVGATLLELYLSEMLDGVSVCEDSPPGNDEATTTRAILPLSLPQQRKVWLRVPQKTFTITSMARTTLAPSPSPSPTTTSTNSPSFSKTLGGALFYSG